MPSLNVFTKQEWTVGEIKLDKGLAASVPGILFTLKDNTHPFNRCWLYRDRAITEQYPLLIGIPIWAKSNIADQGKKTIIPKTITAYDFFLSCVAFFFSFSLFSLACFLPAACLERIVTLGTLDFYRQYDDYLLMETTFSSLTLKYPVLVYHFEIIAMFTRHWSVNRDIWSAGRLELEAQVIVGFRPQKPSFLMCYLDAWEWLPIEQKSHSMEIRERDAHFEERF